MTKGYQGQERNALKNFMSGKSQGKFMISKENLEKT